MSPVNRLQCAQMECRYHHLKKNLPPHATRTVVLLWALALRTTWTLWLRVLATASRAHPPLPWLYRTSRSCINANIVIFTFLTISSTLFTWAATAMNIHSSATAVGINAQTNTILPAILPVANIKSDSWQHRLIWSPCFYYIGYI